MAQLITTKFAAPTNSRGARIIVKSWLGSTTFSYDYGMETGENHAAAVREHIKHITEVAAERGHEVDYKIVGDNAEYWYWLGCNSNGDGYGCVVV